MWSTNRDSNSCRKLFVILVRSRAFLCREYYVKYSPIAVIWIFLAGSVLEYTVACHVCDVQLFVWCTVAAFDIQKSLWVARSIFWCDVRVSKLFSQLFMHVQLSSHRGSRGCRAVCTHPNDYATTLCVHAFCFDLNQASSTVAWH